MTKNRARIRATKDLAKTEGIRHPEASYLADHRKLRLADGTIHDFTTGPVRFLGLPGHGQVEAFTKAVREADAKGWHVASVPHNGPLLRRALAGTGPCLVVVYFEHHEVGTGPDSLVAEIEAGNHPGHNVIIIREPRPGEHLQDPAVGRNIYFRGEKSASNLAADAARDALDALGVPGAAQEFATRASGLYVVTGTTGQGKTTTGAALLRRACANGRRGAAILHPAESSTVEFPGVTFHSAEDGDVGASIRAAVADGAQVILVDGLNDAKAIEAALDAAFGGALVLATMFTQASGTAQRLMDDFPGSGNAKTRAKIQLALRGVIEQVLVRKTGDQAGHILAAEVWVEAAPGSNAVLTPVTTLKESLTALLDRGEINQGAVDKAMLHRWAVTDGDPGEQAKARIAFALRFADILSAGADAASALKAVAGELAAFGTPETTCLADAARSGIAPLRSGWKLSEVISQGALRDAVGEHIAEVVKVASDSGKTAVGLRAAAATLEAELRIGLIA